MAPTATGNESVPAMSSFVLALLFILLLIVIAMLGVLVFAAVKLLRTYAMVKDPRMPPIGKAAFWGAIVYMLSPLDLLPDPILLDDIALVMLATAFIRGRAAEAGIGPGRLTDLQRYQPIAGIDQTPGLDVDRFGGIEGGTSGDEGRQSPELDDYWGWPRPEPS